MYPTTIIVSAVISIFIGLTGCAVHRAEEPWPASRSLDSDIPSFRFSANKSDTAQEPKMEEPAGNITLRQALAQALMKNPSLKSFFWEARALEATILQAGLIPNLEVKATTTEDLGVGAQAQQTILLSQLIELGEKRSKRVQAASTTHTLAGWDYETKRIGVITETYQAFIDVLSAQKRAALAEDMVRLAEQVVEIVSNRVKAGKVSPVENSKTGIALSLARIEVERANRELEASRVRLVGTWGGAKPLFKSAEGDIETIAPIPSLDRLTLYLSQNPELARWSTEISQRRAMIALEEAKAIPNITVSGGYQTAGTVSNSPAFVAGVSIPLPIFDRNQGKILEARHRLAKGEEEKKAAETRVNNLLSQTYRALSTAHAEATALKSNILPRTQSTFDAVNEGYRLGKFALLDVLDAQRTLFDTRVRYLYSITAYHKAVADIEQLIGERLETLSKIKNDKGS